MNTHIANMVHFPTCRKVWLNSVCWPPRAKPDNEVECRIYEGWVKTPVIFLSRLWAQVHEVSRRCKNPLYFPMPLSDCLPCFIQKMFSIKSRNRRNNDQMYTVFGPNFWEGTTPISLREIVITIYCPPFGKAWLSSVCWCSTVKRSNEVECRKLRSNFKPFVDQSSWHFETM